MTADTKKEAVGMALASVRSSLKHAQAFVLAVAAVAGMSATDAKAWGSEYENLGRVIGGELGRDAAGGGYSGKGRIGGLIGETVGRELTRPIDQRTREEERLERIRAQAREQAMRDAVYEAERRRIDPNYDHSARSSHRANQNYGAFSAMENNLREIQMRNAAIVEQYRQRQR